MNKAKAKIKNSFNEQSTLAVICHITFIYFGKFLLKNEKFKSYFDRKIYVQKYEDILQQANLKILPEEFFMTSFILICTLWTLFIGSLIFLFFNFPSQLNFFTLLAGVIVVIIGGITFYNYPLYCANERARNIDAAIPHILPYLKLLSSDLKLADIILLMDEFVIYSEVKKEFEKIRYYNEFLGLDLMTAIKRATKTCPSKKLSEILNDIVTITNSGGDIYSYLETKVDHTNQEIEATEKQTLDSTMIMSQIYIVFLLIGPLLAAVVLSIFSFISFSSIGSPTGGSSTAVSSSKQLFYFVFMLFVLPIMYGFFYFIVYMIKPLYSRIGVM